MGIFNIDNKFFRALNKLVDMVILSFCWIISCIPVFTIGAASTALYDTSRRVIHHDEGYVWRGYWHAFKVNAAAWAIYTSAYISRFEQVTKITLKNTILILIANLPWTLLVIVILVVSLILAWIIIPLIFILPVGAALTYEFIFERIFRKLMPEEDRLREEEKDKEYRD
ncbi:MAG: YesL family protein [[Eubacterium] rectale]|nr:YesL family protein [Agathobacter rectalis]